MKVVFIFVFFIFGVSCQSSTNPSNESHNMGQDSSERQEKNVNHSNKNKSLVQGKAERTRPTMKTYFVTYEPPKEFKTISKLEVNVISYYEEDADIYFSVGLVCADKNNQIISEFSYQTQPQLLPKQSTHKIIFHLPQEILSQDKNCQGGLGITPSVIHGDKTNPSGKHIWLKYKYDRHGNILIKEHPHDEEYFSVEITDEN
jgi:hypothetical protein